MKDRKFNVTSGSIFASGRPCQSSISHREVSESAKKPSSAPPVARKGAAGGDFPGYRRELPLTSDALS